MNLFRRLSFASRLGVAIAVLLLSPVHANATEPLTPEEIVALDQLGFTEAEIRVELEPFDGRYEIDAAGVQALESAGFSPEFVTFVQSLRPQRQMANSDVAEMLGAGASAVEVLRAMVDAQTNFDTSARALLDLGETAELPLSVVSAMRGSPLSSEDLESLAEAAISNEELTLLISLVDVANEPLSPATALALVQSGIDSNLVGSIRARATAKEPQELPPQDQAAAVDFTTFDHVMGLFSLRYPGDWRLVRQIEAGDIFYFVTPERGVSDVAQMRMGAALMVSALGEADELDPRDIASRVTRSLQIHDPAPVFDEEIHDTTIAGKPGIYRSYSMEIDEAEEPIRGRLYFTTSGSYAYALIAQAPESAFDANLPVFEHLVAELEVGYEKWATGDSDERHTTDSLTRRYEEAVVQVRGREGNRIGFGSGFIVREDGYLLTNAHVVQKPDSDEFWEEITVHWPERFGREPAAAEVVDAYFVQSELGQRTLGGILSVEADIALLKISTSELLPTVPITRQRDVRLGDSVFVIGYPRSNDFDNQVSTTVTSGVITRYLHGDDRQIQMIVTDAKIAGGNSGGPVINVRTGGVVGLATTAISQELIGGLEQANVAPDRASQLIGYNGVLPIAKALRLFPQVMTVSADRDRRIDYLDAYDLALRSVQQGWWEGAIRSAEEAVELGRRNADAYSLLGRLKSELGSNEAMLEEGRKALETALDIDPEHLPTMLFQIDHDLENRAYLEAMRQANRAVSTAPLEWQARYARAQVNQVLKRYDEALDDLAEAQRLSADLFPEPYNLAGTIYYEKEEYEEGKEQFDRAVEIAPTDVDARLGVGHYYLKAANPFSALVEFDDLNAEMPKQPKVLYAMGEAYRHLDDHLKALEQYSLSVALFFENRQVPPEDLLLDAARLAANNLHDEESGVLFHALHLNHYFESDQALASHQFLADVAKDDGPAISRAHLTRAEQLLRGSETDGDDSERAERIRKQLEEVRTATLATDDIVRMRNARYPDLLVARIVLMEGIPLALQLNGSTNADGEHDAQRSQHLQELAQQFGPTIRTAIEIKVRTQEVNPQQQGAQQAQAEPGNRQQEANAGGGDNNRRTAELPGTWLHQGRSGQIELNLNPDRTYTITVIRQGQRQPFDRGQWRIGEDRASLVLAGPQQQGETQYRTQVADPNTIVLVNGDNQWRYEKQ